MTLAQLQTALAALVTAGVPTNTPVVFHSKKMRKRRPIGTATDKNIPAKGTQPAHRFVQLSD